MHLFQIAVVALALLAPSQEASGRQPASCHEWHECRQLALDAFDRGEYERFHDLAWRTVQTGPPRDPALMYLLARAQSLSGRPHDALVMLGRLADMGVPTDAATNDEFRNVRALHDWPDLEAKLRARPGPDASAAPAAPPSATRAERTEAVAAPPAPPAPPGAALSPREEAAPTPPQQLEDALRLPTVAFSPRGLAYDGVSGRFVVADRGARKLVVLDERSHHAVDLVRGSSGGFADIGAFEIDPRRGDLWVVSDDPPTADGDRRSVAALHKLQLVSGRPLVSFTLPDRFGAARFSDVAVTAAGTVFVLDQDGGRIFSFQQDSRTFTLVSTLTLAGVTSIAPADEHTVYVAYADGLARVDVATGAASPLRAAADVQLTGFGRIRSNRGAIVGVQRAADGRYQAVTIRLTGGRAAAVTLMKTDAPISDPTAVTISGDDVYVLTRSGDDMLVQRARLR